MTPPRDTSGYASPLVFPATLLVVGAGGFIGGFIARRALGLGYDTWAGLRKSTSRRWLTDPQLHFAVFDYDNPEAIAKALQEYAPVRRDGTRGWDYIIWNLGATKCADMRDFDRINYGYLRNFADALQAAGMLPYTFLYVSSLSALGLGDEKNYTPFTGQSVPHPNTAYGRSKIKAEQYLDQHPDIPWIIFRPTGVYGPHEKDYLMMIQSIDRHIDVSMGYKPQMLTFVYVDDLVEAMFLALQAGGDVLHRKYIISEDRAYSQKEFRKIVARHLGGRFVLPLALPMWVVYGVSVASEKLAAIRGKASTLNRDKYIIMRQRNWTCDISDAVRDFCFRPHWPLDRGIAATVAAYRQSKSKYSVKV